MNNKFNLIGSILSSHRVLISMYLGYGTMMVCRQMLTILSPALLADESLGLSKTNIADFAAYGTLGALTGKFFWGPIGDKIGGGKTFLLALFFSALGLLVFSSSINIMSFTVSSFLLYFAHSGGWPGMTKIVAETYEPQRYGRIWGILSTSSRLSVVLGTLFFGFLLSYFPWHIVAWCAVGISVLIWSLSRWFIPRKRVKKEGPGSSHSLKEALIEFSQSSRFYLMLIMMMLLTCMMAFLDFLPMYLFEVYKLSTSQASIASASFPFGCLLGLIIASIFYDRLGKKGVRRFIGIQLGIAAILLLVLQGVSGFDISETKKLIVAVLIISCFGFMLAPAYYLPSSIFSIEFGKAYSATLICLIDASGFAASATFNFVGGRITDSAGGWNYFMGVLFIITLGAAVFSWIFLHREYKLGLSKNQM